MSCLLSVVRSFTGDCTNSSVGAINVEITGSAPDYTIQWVQPSSYGVISLGAGVTGYTQTGLSGGTFIFNVVDSCAVENTVLPVSFYISTGTCVSITSTQDTTCNFNNGILTASTANLYNETASFYLYNNSLGYVTSGFSYTNEYIFTNLSPGTYYVIGDDGGGCTGKSETCIVKPSTELDFGFFVVNNSNCGNGNTGKLYVTGLTGNAPYYYLWSNGTIDDYLTGLTSGNYSVTITDSSGCIVNKSVNVNDVPLIGLLSLSTINPDCFIANGSATINITGGAAPYFFSGSNGYSEVSYSTSYTFNNLGSGNFIISVTDAGLCNFTTNTSLISPQGFSVVNVGINNSTCNNSSGSLSPIILIGPNQPYVYSLTYPDGSIMTNTTTSTFWQYTNLSSGTYSLSISGGTCLFTQPYEINNTVVYTLSATTTPSTCDRINGSVLLEISQGGVAPYTFTITGKPPIQTSFSSVTFNNLLSDTYTVTVIDSNGCAQTDTIIINSSPTVDFVLNKNDATTGSNGSIQTYITSGTPPFTYLWSNGQTTPNISGLNDGDYTLTVTDINGCVKQRTITINGYDKISSYQSYTICDDVFADGGNIKKGIKQMYVEGYFDSISDDYNCILDSATFIAQVAVGNEINSFPFYLSNSLTDYPYDNEWFEFVKLILEDYPNIGDVIIDYVGNTITINTNCDPESLFNTNVIVRLRIEYIISCEKCNLSCDIEYTQIITPTPTPTPTQIPLEEFIINAVGVTQIYSTTQYSGFTIISSLTYQIDWGDGNIETFPPGTTKINHIYSSPYLPYTGQIKILSTDLTTITSFASQSNPHNSQSLWTSTSELQKLDGLISLVCNLTNGLFITGDVNDLPNTLNFLSTSNNNLSGNTSNIPPLLTVMNIQGSNTISGDTSGFTNTLTSSLSLYGNNTVSGNVSDLPTSDNIQIYGFNTISGDTSGIPMSTRFQIDGYNTISGDVSNLPSTLVRCTILGDNTISGNVSGFTAPIEIIVIQGDNTISGDISGLPLSVIAILIVGFNTISGDVQYLPPNMISLSLYNKSLAPNTVSIFGNISTLPSNLTTFNVVSTGVTSGDLYYIPSGVTEFTLQSNMTFTYTSGRNWASNFLKLTINPSGSWVGFNSTETDNILIDIQPKYINTGNSKFIIKCGSTPKRTSASDAAFTALQTLIGAGNVELN